MNLELSRMNHDMLKRQDIKLLIRATQRRWGVAVEAREIMDLVSRSARDPTLVRSVDQLVGVPSTPAWRKYETRAAAEYDTNEGDDDEKIENRSNTPMLHPTATPF